VNVAAFPGHSPIFYGIRNEDRDSYVKSSKLNRECAQKLEKAIGKHFGGYHLDKDAVLDEVKEYSVERISVILANTMRLREGDGRFSSENRKWAQSVRLPESSIRNTAESINSHSVLVDSLIETIREKEISRADPIQSRPKQHEPPSPGERELSQTQGPNMAEVQAAESKASLIQGLDKSADGLSRVEGQDIGLAEESYVMAANDVKYEAQRARTADGEIKGREGLQLLKNPQIGQRVTFIPHGGNEKDTELTGKVAAADARTVTLDCGNRKIPAIREKGDFFEAPPLKHEQTKAFAQEQARKLMGENGNIFFAQDKGAYKGEIIGKTPTYAIQKINGETAILHRLKDLAAAQDNGNDKNSQGLIREGQEVSIVKDEAGVSVMHWSKEREEREKVRERQKSRGALSR
jgi:hypothetical protein